MGDWRAHFIYFNVIIDFNLRTPVQVIEFHLSSNFKLEMQYFWIEDFEQIIQNEIWQKKFCVQTGQSFKGRMSLKTHKKSAMFPFKNGNLFWAKLSERSEESVAIFLFFVAFSLHEPWTRGSVIFKWLRSLRIKTVSKHSDQFFSNWKLTFFDPLLDGNRT